VVWHDEAGTRLGLAVWVCMHARGSWLPRAASWPCCARSTGMLGPWHDAMAERATAAASLTSGVVGSCTRAAQGRMGKGDPKGRAKEGSSAARGSRQQQGTGGDGGDAHRWLAGEVLAMVTSRCRRVGAVQGTRPRRGHRIGVGVVKALLRRWPSPPCAPLLLLFLPLLLLWCGGGGRERSLGP
jgi:hypothetical protein